MSPSGAPLKGQCSVVKGISTNRPGSSPGQDSLRMKPFRSYRSKLPSDRTNRISFELNDPGGDDGTRTRDIRLAKAALSQLSYIPFTKGSGLDWIRTSDPCVISTVL